MAVCGEKTKNTACYAEQHRALALEVRKVVIPGTNLVRDGASNAPASLSDYAAKVREAYAAMKKRRVADSAV